MVRRDGSGIQSRVYQRVARRLVWAAGGTICTRRPMLRARLLLCGLALILAAGSWRPAPTLAQLPAGTPTYNANAKWVTDRGSQVFNVKAYGAKGDGTTDDTTAINAAITAAGVGGLVLFPPGTYLVSSQLQLLSANQTWSGYGATLLANMASAVSPIMVGSVTSQNNNVTYGNGIYGLGIEPGTNTSTVSAIQDAGWWTKIVDVHPVYHAANSFLHFVENDDDQAQVIDHLYNLAISASACSASPCPSAVYGSSVHTGGISWIHNTDFSSNCTTNPIDWETGNDLHIDNSIFQAFSQYALLAVGGPGKIDISGNTHWEQGNCTNPLNDGNGHALGGAGLIEVGANVTIEGGIGAGGVGGTRFSTNAVGGSSTYWYYVVGHNGASVTAPLLIGYLTNGPATISSPNAVVYSVWPMLAATGVTTFDLLATNGTVPYGTGNFAVATGLAVGTYCTASGGLVCAYTDTGTRSSYTIATENLYAQDKFWPGNLVLFANGQGFGNAGVSSYSGPSAQGLVVNAAPNDVVFTHYQVTGPLSAGGTGGYPTGPGSADFGTVAETNSPSAGHLIPAGHYGGIAKGAYNFGNQQSSQDAITIYDSNYPSTLADSFKRPLWSAADAALCYDLHSGSCLRGATVSQYIGVLPDSSHFATRTTSTGIADGLPHYGLQSISAGAPNTPTLADESAATTCLTSHGYANNAVCFDGTNFEMAQVLTTFTGTTGATAPTWATTPGQTTMDGYVTWTCLGTGSLAANTAYYFKTAGCTLGGCSTASSQATVTTANDGAAHMILLTGTAKAGHTSYQVGCSTSSGAEALLTAPFTGAYTGAAYALPAMSCSGSGSFNASDQSGYESVMGLCFNGANCNTSWPGASALTFGSTTINASATAPTSGQVIGYNGGVLAGVAPNATGLTFGSTTQTLGASAPTSGQCLEYNGSNIVGTSCGGGSQTVGGWMGANLDFQPYPARLGAWWSYNTAVASLSYSMPFSASIGGWGAVVTVGGQGTAEIGLAEFLNGTTATLNQPSYLTLVNTTTNASYSGASVPSSYVMQGTPITVVGASVIGTNITVGGVSAQVTGVNAQPLGGFLNSATISVGTVYSGFSTSPTPNATETNMEIPISLPSGGTIQNFCFTMGTPGNGASASLTATVRHNGASTSLTATAGNSAAAYSTFCDLNPSHAFTVAYEDTVDVMWVDTGATSGALASVSAELIPSGSATGMVIFGADLISTSGSDRWIGPFTSLNQSSDPLAGAMAPRAATVTNVVCNVTAAPTGASETVYFRQNSANASASVTIPTSFSAPGIAAMTGTVSLNQGDLFDLYLHGVVTTTAATFSACSAAIQ